MSHVDPEDVYIFLGRENSSYLVTQGPLLIPVFHSG